MDKDGRLRIKKIDTTYHGKTKTSYIVEISDNWYNDFAYSQGIDLESHIKAKMLYNETRPIKHGKDY